MQTTQTTVIPLSNGATPSPQIVLPKPEPLAKPAPAWLVPQLAQAFNLDEMQVELCSELNVSYENLKGDNLSTKCLALVEYFRSRGQIDELIAQAKVKRPHLSWEPPADSGQNNKDPGIITVGLSKLTEAVKEDKIQVIINEFRPDFEFARSRITKLSELNRLQTLLQQTEALYNHLETDFYEQLLKISEYKFAQPPKIIQVIYWTGAEDVAWVALIPPLRSLFDTLSALLTKVDPANPPNVEASPLPSPLWMERLSMARSDLQNSIAKKDGASLELALNRIKRALDIGPYEMGARLVMMVEDLLTNNLLAHMTNLNQKLMTTTTDPAVQTQFADLLVAMDRLKTSLSKAIVDYTEWNNIRRELRFIRYNLSPIQDRDDFKSAYHDVVETVRKLAGGSLDDWALSLVKLGDETLQDIEQIPANPANHLAAVQNQFNAYQSQVAEQHHKADEQLLAASHDLEQLEASLTALIRTLMPSA